MEEIETSWHSYPKVYALGHAAIKELLFDDVIVEEKLDGSQFSFGKFGDEIRCKSRRQVLNIDEPEKLFSAAVEVVKSLDLRNGWTYRAEYFQKPKHNALAYERIPENHLIVFDINTGHESYLSYDEKKVEAERLGLECVPCLKRGRISSSSELTGLLEHKSVLGGAMIEGVVVKNYSRFSTDGKAMIGKYVSEAFKEIHVSEWNKTNPGPKNIIAQLGDKYRHVGRWTKAQQRLRDDGTLEGSPKDIGALLREVPIDIESECSDEIKDALYKWAWPQIRRMVTSGLPQWYKERLLEQQFTPDK